MKNTKQFNQDGDNTLTNDIFVIKYKKEYRILTTNSEKAIKIFDDKKAAIRFAIILQGKMKTSIFVMDGNGRLVEFYPYVNLDKVKEIIVSENDTSDKELNASSKVATALSY